VETTLLVASVTHWLGKLTFQNDVPGLPLTLYLRIALIVWAH